MTAEISFERDHAPLIGVVETLERDLRVVTAPNGGPMTYTGSRSYLLGQGDVALIDPGPENKAHLDALLTALAPDEKISHIFVTHSHLDHSGLAQEIAKHFNAPVFGFGDWRAGRSSLMDELALTEIGGGEGVDRDFSPEHMLKDGERVSGNGWELEAIHTPGHMGNHLSFASDAHGALFSGDHVMGWSTCLISPPDGDLTQYMASLKKLRLRNERRYYPGHGAPIENPDTLVGQLFDHRRSREAQILGTLDPAGSTPAEIAQTIYTNLPSYMLPVATRNVLAHLIDLHSRDFVEPVGKFALSSRFVVNSKEI